MKIISSIFLMLLIASCIIERDTNYRATLYNPTDHNIKILFYKGGIVNGSDTIILEPNTNFQIANGTRRGKSKVRGFSSDYAGSPDDSVIVEFDNKYRMTHYANTPPSLAERYYLFNSSRNILNPYSYEFEIIDDGVVINDHKYYFTEQDYLDAKD